MRTSLWIGVLALAVLVGPVVVKQLAPAERRSFEAVRLSDLAPRDVFFRNDAQQIDLAGMLFEPVAPAPRVPAAVMIHGSGGSRRDNGWYLTLVAHLVQHGIVVLLPDKRGSERSGGDWRTASYEDLATDTAAAVRFLRTRLNGTVGPVGLIGMSQGGRIAPLVAAQDPDIAFVVNVVGGAIPAHASLRFEEKHNLCEMGFLPGIADLLAWPAAWSLIHVRQKDYWARVGNFDPLDWWRRVDAPALVLYGERDTNVHTAASVRALRSLARDNLDVRVYAGSGHALESPEGRGNALFRPEALRDIAGFVHAAVSDADAGGTRPAGPKF